VHCTYISWLQLIIKPFQTLNKLLSFIFCKLTSKIVCFLDCLYHLIHFSKKYTHNLK
jgi:hypothetical protein